MFCLQRDYLHAFSGNDSELTFVVETVMSKQIHAQTSEDNVGRGVDNLRTDGRKDVYYQYNLCYTFEHHLILIFKSIPIVKRI